MAEIKGKLFISYSYTARDGEQYYTGFSNMIGHRLIYAPQDEGHIEALEQEARKKCCEEFGFDDCTTKIMWWKTMDGS